MSEASNRLENREVALADFDHGRDAFVRCYDPVPDAALRFVPPGEDYTLGGLAVHVKQSLEHYARVLDQMRSHDYQTFRVDDPPEDAGEHEMVRQGFDGGKRAGVLADVAKAHDSVASRILALPADEYLRVAPVYYGDSNDTWDTKGSDVMGWVIDHYNEHVKQIAELLEKWRATSGKS